MDQGIVRAMLVRKAFRYRVYPTPQQEARLLAWESALRFLWNLALEQRKMGLARPRDERIFLTAFDQINELTDLRAELPWLADVPRNVCAQLLVELDKAWQRCFKRLSLAPRWKRKGRDFLGLTEPHAKVWRLDGSRLRFPKLGKLRTKVHRPLEGSAKSCTLKREGDQWFVSIFCEFETADPAPKTEPTVALDRGVNNLIGDSDGNLVVNPAHFERAMKRLARAQRVVSRRKKGSKNRKKAVDRVKRLHRKIRRQREHVLHSLSNAYAKSHGTVIVERLQIRSMVRANSGLARKILRLRLGTPRRDASLQARLAKRATGGGAGCAQLADVLRMRRRRCSLSIGRALLLHELRTRRSCRPQRCKSSEKPCESLGSAPGGIAARELPAKGESGCSSCSTSTSTKLRRLGRG